MVDAMIDDAHAWALNLMLMMLAHLALSAEGLGQVMFKMLACLALNAWRAWAAVNVEDLSS